MTHDVTFVRGAGRDLDAAQQMLTLAMHQALRAENALERMQPKDHHLAGFYESAKALRRKAAELADAAALIRTRELINYETLDVAGGGN